EAILREFQFIIAQNWIPVDSVVRRRANIMRESAQRQLRGLDAAAHDRPPLEHQAAIARFRQIRSRNQAIVPGPSHHDIEWLSHYNPYSPSQIHWMFYRSK